MSSVKDLKYDFKAQFSTLEVKSLSTISVLLAKCMQIFICTVQKNECYEKMLNVCMSEMVLWNLFLIWYSCSNQFTMSDPLKGKA